MSNNKIIEKTGKAQFKVSTEGVADSTLQLDFNPVIARFDLVGDFYLVHWQARPKGYREWGIYNSRDDSYRSTEKIARSYGSFTGLQLNDGTASTIPSAVLVFRGYLET